MILEGFGFIVGVFVGLAIAYVVNFLAKEKRASKLVEDFEALRGEVWRSKGPVIFFVGLQKLRLFVVSKNLLSDANIYAFFEKHLVKIGPRSGYQFVEDEISEIKHDLFNLEIKD